jgi:MFS transporter, DHA2 family, multidrug resistance protein
VAICNQFTPYQRWLITFAVMTASLLQVLDTTIVNVALPHMEGALGANPDQITWVLTSYLVASAIFMPLTGYFTDKLGQKNYLLISILGFIIASALCGAAVNISEIVLFRLLQGIFGAALVPLSQSIMTDIFPAEDRGSAMAIWGIGIMVGPILGPTLGGYLTEVASWRWTFYINIPFGLMCLMLTWQFVPDTVKKERRMDWLGLSLISIAIGATQYFLDRGNQDNWFESRGICIACFLSLAGLLAFLLHNLENKNGKTVFDLSIFLDRNFAIASLLLSIFGLGLYGALILLPLMLEGLMNYPVLTTGLVMAPRGISGIISMILVGQWIKHYDPRMIIFGGIIISALGMWLGTYYSMNIDLAWIIGPLLLQGFGLGMVFVPLSAVAFSTLAASKRAEAAGLFSLLRTMGGSIGISIVSTILVRHTQIAWNQLGGFINPYNQAVTLFLNPLHLLPSQPLGTAILAKLLATQAHMLSFIDVYAFITWCFIAMLPCLFLLKKGEVNSSSTVIIHGD